MTAAHGADAVKEAAAIWAHAKACRDGDPEPATVEETAPGIRRRLSLDGARLFLAWWDDRPVGFTLFAPRARSLEVFYLGVHPDAWGRGVGGRLLLLADEQAREIGRRTLELWVINDNERAVRVYERSGWVGTDEVKRDPSSGRLERRFLRQLPQARVRVRTLREETADRVASRVSAGPEPKGVGVERGLVTRPRGLEVEPSGNGHQAPVHPRVPPVPPGG